MRVPLSTVRLLRQAWLVLAGLLLTICAGMSANAARRALENHPGQEAASPAASARGYEADEHFPGAAALYAVGEIAAPAAGVTGTTALPDMPVPVPALAAVDSATSDGSGIVPAQPFSFGRATSLDRGRALECLTAAVYYEAASEPDAGQQAVAQVVLNRVRHPAFPATVCGVVYQGSERRGCQFSFACDGSMARVPSRGGWARAARVAVFALAGRVYAPIGLATHYHTYAVTPVWNRSLVMTDVVGAHFFHRWKGWWGTAAAFRQVYLGAEPVPGPHAPLVTAPLAPDPPVIAAASPVMPGAAAPMSAPAGVKPAEQGGGAAPAAAAVEGNTSSPAVPVDRLPAAPTVRPEYASSGTMH